MILVILFKARLLPAEETGIVSLQKNSSAFRFPVRRRIFSAPADPGKILGLVMIYPKVGNRELSPVRPWSLYRGETILHSVRQI